MVTFFLTLLIIASGAAHLWAEYQKPVRQYHIYLFKPLTVALIILLAFLQDAQISEAYRNLIIAGLVASIGGDIMLMLPERYFLPGLVSFLTAHLIYIGAFTVESDHSLLPVLLLPLAVFGIGMTGVLWPHLEMSMRGPVLFYIVVILMMSWQALSRWLDSPPPGAALAAIGAMLFMLSDTVLALNRFYRPLPYAQAVIMVTYYSAQWFIALSI